jgi:hypothetical protein
VKVFLSSPVGLCQHFLESIWWIRLGRTLHINKVESGLTTSL